jgi:hypothetical protein
MPDSAAGLGTAPVDASVITVLAALTGAAASGLTSGVPACAPQGASRISAKRTKTRRTG